MLTLGDRMHQTAQEIWQRALVELKGEMTPTSYNTWILTIDPVCKQGDTLILQAQNDIARNTLRNLYSATIDKALTGANNGRPTNGLLIVHNEREQYERLAREGDPDLMLNPRYTSVSYTHLDVYKRQS